MGDPDTETEYVDYSCSTALERLSRDIEGVLRKWHLNDNDRHISMKASSGSVGPGTRVRCWPPSDSSAGCETSSHASSHASSKYNSKTLGSAKSHMAPVFTLVNDNLSPTRRSGDFDTLLSPSSIHSISFTNLSNNHMDANTPLSQPTGSPQQFSAFSRGDKSTRILDPVNHRILRRKELVYSLSSANIFAESIDCETFLRRGIPLTITLWDGPPPAYETFVGVPYSLQRRGSPLNIALCDVDDFAVETVFDTTIATLNFPATGVQTSDLSSLLGIGQHITICPSFAFSLGEKTSVSSAARNRALELSIPCIVTALNIAIINARCSIPAFGLGSWYDPLFGIPLTAHFNASDQRKSGGSIATGHSWDSQSKPRTLLESSDISVSSELSTSDSIGYTHHSATTRNDHRSCASLQLRSISSHQLHARTIRRLKSASSLPGLRNRFLEKSDRWLLSSGAEGEIAAFPSWLLKSSDLSSAKGSALTTSLQQNCHHDSSPSFRTRMVFGMCTSYFKAENHLYGLFTFRSKHVLEVFDGKCLPSACSWPVSGRNCPTTRDGPAIQFLKKVFLEHLRQNDKNSATNNPRRSYSLHYLDSETPSNCQDKYLMTKPSQTVYTYRWRKTESSEPNRAKSSRGIGRTSDNIVHKAISVLRTTSSGLSVQDRSPTMDGNSISLSNGFDMVFSWRAASLLSPGRQLDSCGILKKYALFIHTYEVLANCTSIFKSRPYVYAKLMHALAPFRQRVLGVRADKNEQLEVSQAVTDGKRPENDHSAEFLFGPSSEPIDRILLRLLWNNEQSNSSASQKLTSSIIPSAVSAHCVWDDFVKQPVVINPLSAHVRYIFASCIFAQTCFSSEASAIDVISPTLNVTTRVIPSLTATSLYKDSETTDTNLKYVGSTTRKLVAAMQSMLHEQLRMLDEDYMDDSETVSDVKSFEKKKNSRRLIHRVNPSDLERISQRIDGILNFGHLWDGCDSSPSSSLPHESACIQNGATHGRLLSQLCFYLSRQPSPRMMMVAWSIFIDEIKSCCSEKRTLPNMPPLLAPQKNGVSNGRRDYYNSFRCGCSESYNPVVNRDMCLLEQKLEILNLSILSKAKAIRTSTDDQSPSSPPSTKDFQDINFGDTCLVGDVESASSAHNVGTQSQQSGSFCCCGGDKRRDLERQTDKMGCNRVELGMNLTPRTREDNDESSGVSSCSDNKADIGMVSKENQSRARSGALGPVQGLFSKKTGLQIFAPFVQPACPLTFDTLLEVYFLITRQSSLNYHRNEDRCEALMKILRYNLKPTLLSDMQAFKAANPGCSFKDFESWYGHSVDILDFSDRLTGSKFVTGKMGVDSDFECDMVEIILARHANKLSYNEECSVTDQEPSNNSQQKKLKFREVLASSDVRAMSLNFWKDTWDEAQPKPAVDQAVRLFDVSLEREKAICFLENLNPFQLFSQILCVNFSTAHGLLVIAAGDAIHIATIKESLDHLKIMITHALAKLTSDFYISLLTEATKVGQNSTLMSNETESQQFHKKNSVMNDQSDLGLQSDTLLACEAVCNSIGVVELLLSKATSLLHKFPGQYNFIHHLLRRGEGEEVVVSETSIGSGDAKDAQSVRQTKNTGMGPLFTAIHEGFFKLLPESSSLIQFENKTDTATEIVDILELPKPYMREFTLQNESIDQPCQLVAQFRYGQSQTKQASRFSNPNTNVDVGVIAVTLTQKL